MIGGYDIILRVIDLHGNFTEHWFPIDIAPLLPLPEVISIPDPNLAAAVRDTLSLAPSDAITQLDMLGLTDLWDAANRQITDLTGLEHALYIRGLGLWDNQIHDITPLAGLTKLRRLDITRNAINDITPLAGLENLQFLGLLNNQIHDITQLAGLTKLWFLSLSAPLAAQSKIRDITPLATLKELKVLYLSGHQIADITPLVGLTYLGRLDISHNQISDVRPLAGLMNLTWLYLKGNAISDLSPLVANTGLGNADSVEVSGNTLNYASIYTHIPVLQERGVEVFFDHRTPKRIRIISGDNQESLPSAALANPFVVEVQDERRVAFEGVPVTFTVTSGDGTLSTTSTATNTNGRAESILTLGPNPGTNTVTVSAAGIPEGQTFNAVDIRVPKTLEIISGDDQEGLPGAALDKPFAVEVRDQFDKPLPDAQVTFALTSGGGRLSATSVTTNSNGRAESTLTLGPNPGTNTVTVSVTGITRTEMFNAEGIRIPKTLEIISGNDQEGLPGAALDKPFVVEVRDQADTPVPGVQVTFSVARGGGTLSGTSVTTNSNGRAESILTVGPNPGTNTVTVSVAGTQQTETINAEGIRIPETLDIIAGNDQEGAPGAALENPFVVEVRDQTDKPLPGVQVTFSVSSGGGTLSATSAIADVNGRAESILTLGPNPGTNTVEVAATGIHRTQSVSAIAELPPIPQDVNGDDVVNILDLLLVASVLGDEGRDLDADVNRDGVVNILDLVLVAGAFGNAAAPSANPRALAMLTAKDVGQWLAQAGELELTEATSQRGVLFLEQLFAALTPKETALLPNYPNPFNPETWIPYQLARDADVTLTIYDTTGVVVRRLDIGHQLAGHYADRGRAAYWDGRNARGESVASGVYFYTLTAGDFTATRKILIRK